MDIIDLLRIRNKNSIVVEYSPITSLISSKNNSDISIFISFDDKNNQIHIVDDSESDLDIDQIILSASIPISQNEAVFGLEELKNIISNTEASLLIELLKLHKSHPNFPETELLRIMEVLKKKHSLKGIIYYLNVASDSFLKQLSNETDEEIIFQMYQDMLFLLMSE